jgi:hypothetical protein
MQRLHATPNISKDLAQWRCFNCGENGHYAHVCPKPLSHPNRMSSTNPFPNRGANSIFVAARQNLARGRINQVAVEEARYAPMNGTLFISSYYILTIP